MIKYKRIPVPPQVHEELAALSGRDHRPPWRVIQEALHMYRHVHKSSREAPKDIPRRGRPPIS